MIPALRLALPIALALATTAPAQQGDETIVSHGFSAFGELKYPAGFDHFDYVTPDAPQGGTMSFRGTLASQTFDSLNLFILQGEPAQGLELIYDSLMERAYDEPDAIYGQIAESIEYPEDRSWAIFEMRPEARFTDGVPITAEDVVFTIEALQEHGAPRFRALVTEVAQAEALGEHRVKVTFAEGARTRDLPSDVAQLPILPKHYYDEVAFDRSTLEPPVGSGAYEVVDAQPGRSVKYCKTEEYWGADLPVNAGAENFDCYVYQYFADSTAAFEALKVGNYLFHEESYSALWATGYDFPALEKGWVKKTELPDGRPSGAQGFYLNLRRPQLQDMRVREAIGMMFNFEWTNATLFYGLYDQTDSFWENSELQAEGLAEGDEKALLEEIEGDLPPGVLTEPAYSPPAGSKQKTDRKAVREAGALLDEAGWTVGDGGLRRDEAGKVLSVEFIDDNPAFERIILPFVDNLRRIGIDASYARVDSAQMQQRQEDFDYDIMAARLVPTLTPSSELGVLFGSESADAPGSYNLSGLRDPAVDALIDRVTAATSRDEMVTAVHALDRVLRALHIWVPNWYKGSHWIAYWDVFGRPETKPPYDRGVDFWWIDQHKYDALKAKGALR